MSDLERNKKNVVAFYDLMFNQCRPREAIEEYTGATYIQHNSGVTDGKEGFIAYIQHSVKGVTLEEWCAAYRASLKTPQDRKEYARRNRRYERAKRGNGRR